VYIVVVTSEMFLELASFIRLNSVRVSSRALIFVRASPASISADDLALVSSSLSAICVMRLPIGWYSSQVLSSLARVCFPFSDANSGRAFSRLSRYIFSYSPIRLLCSSRSALVLARIRLLLARSR